MKDMTLFSHKKPKDVILKIFYKNIDKFDRDQGFKNEDTFPCSKIIDATVGFLNKNHAKGDALIISKVSLGTHSKRGE